MKQSYDLRNAQHERLLNILRQITAASLFAEKSVESNLRNLETSLTWEKMVNDRSPA